MEQLTYDSKDLLIYNPKAYKAEIESLVEQNKAAKKPLLEGVELILEKMRKQVALITFETNAFRISIDDGKLDRI